MSLYNLYFAWCWFLLGLGTGAVQGLFFHRENWLGGYGSWPRRMTRLGHIAFFGTGLLNLCFAFTVLQVNLAGRALEVASTLLIVGAVTMSSVCYLSAWRKSLRQLFFIPVASLLVGVGLLLVSLFGAVTSGS
jgi:hypothetical protein